jgi:hypothetical protein
LTNDPFVLHAAQVVVNTAFNAALRM